MDLDMDTGEPLSHWERLALDADRLDCRDPYYGRGYYGNTGYGYGPGMGMGGMVSLP